MVIGAFGNRPGHVIGIMAAIEFAIKGHRVAHERDRESSHFAGGTVRKERILVIAIIIENADGIKEIIDNNSRWLIFPVNAGIWTNERGIVQKISMKRAIVKGAIEFRAHEAHRLVISFVQIELHVPRAAPVIGVMNDMRNFIADFVLAIRGMRICRLPQRRSRILIWERAASDKSRGVESFIRNRVYNRDRFTYAIHVGHDAIISSIRH